MPDNSPQLYNYVLVRVDRWNVDNSINDTRVIACFSEKRDADRYIHDNMLKAPSSELTARYKIEHVPYFPSWQL